MTKAQICIMISIVVYLFAMVMIGVVYSKKTKNVGDFYLGGRKLGPLVTAMSAEASDMSSYLLMGLARSCSCKRPCRSRLDGYRPCGRYISQLAYRCQKAS